MTSTSGLWRFLFTALMLFHIALQYVEERGANVDRFSAELPSLEIVVRVRGSDIAVAAAFPAGENGWDVCVAIDDTANAASVADACELAAAAFRSANWQRLDDLPEDETDIPF